jgi:hypothetical protein
MATTRTWYDDANVDVAYATSEAVTSAKLVWTLKALLRTEVSGTNGATGPTPSLAGWTCAGSSDSATAAMDSTDRWGSTFNAAKIVWNNPTVAHSWIVLQSPNDIGGSGNGTYQLLLACESDDVYTVSVYVSKSGFTGGSTTARPTATDEVTVNAIGSYYASDLTADNRMSMTRTSNGAFYVYWWNPGTSFVPTFFGCVDPISLKSAVQWRLFGLWSYAGTSPGVVPASGSAATVFARAYDATSAAAHNIFIPCSRDGLTFWSDIAGTDPADSKYDALPAHIFCTDTTYRGYRGKVPDAYLPQAGASTGDVTPSTGSPERVLLSGYWIPCGVAPDFSV